MIKQVFNRFLFILDDFRIFWPIRKHLDTSKKYDAIIIWWHKSRPLRYLFHSGNFWGGFRTRNLSTLKKTSRQDFSRFYKFHLIIDSRSLWELLIKNKNKTWGRCLIFIVFSCWSSIQCSEFHFNLNFYLTKKSRNPGSLGGRPRNPGYISEVAIIRFKRWNCPQCVYIIKVKVTTYCIVHIKTIL